MSPQRARRVVRWFATWRRRSASLLGPEGIVVRQPVEEVRELILISLVAASRQASDNEPPAESVDEFRIHPQKMPHDVN